MRNVGSSDAVPEVVLGTNVAKNQVFARKLMRPSFHLSKNDILKEMQTIERLCKQPRHENVVGVYRQAQLEGLYFIDMELCDFNLQQYIYEFDTLNGMPALDTQIMLKIMRDVSQGLAFIHESKKIHRDIKPQNSIFIVVFNNISPIFMSWDVENW